MVMSAKSLNFTFEDDKWSDISSPTQALGSWGEEFSSRRSPPVE
jgi:hypothetical protein